MEAILQSRGEFSAKSLKRTNTVRSLGLSACLALSLTSFAPTWSSQAAFACPCESVVAPTNPDTELHIKDGLAFTRTAEYHKQFSQSVDAAKKFVRKYIAEHPNERQVAVVSDVDETLLDNRPVFEEHPNFVWDDFRSWVTKASAPTLKDTAEFLSWARKNGVAILLVTGRFEKERLATTENLIQKKVSYDALYMRTLEDTGSAITYKSAVRKKIHDQGFNVLVNIGDQWSDLLGGGSIDCEKLPNRIYYIP